MDSELFYRIKKDLCQWDPVDLVTITSEHEYDIECKAIASELQPGMGVFQIATIIRDVLMKHFGDILPANKKELKNTSFPKAADGEFSRRCISMARDVRAYV